MLKRILRSSFAQTALGRVLGWYMLFVGMTTKWEFVDRQPIEQIWAEGGPAVACFWHRHTIASHVGWNISPFRRIKQPGMVMISRSKEGGIVAEATYTVGATVMRGSTSKGAMEATRQALRHMSAGGCAILTPDGPRGPRMRVQMGCVHLAKQKGAPLIGYAWAIAGQKSVKSWDRVVVPPPFSRGVYMWTRPIRVAKNASSAELEAARLEFESEMIRISTEAERRVGAEIVTPNPLPESPPAPAPDIIREAS